MKPSNRPLMNKVVEMLEGEVECSQMPSKPFLSSLGHVRDSLYPTCSSIQSGESCQSSQFECKEFDMSVGWFTCESFRNFRCWLIPQQVRL